MTAFGVLVWMITWILPAWAVMFSVDDRVRARVLSTTASLILVLWGGYIGAAIFAWEAWRWTHGLPMLGSTLVWLVMFALYEQSLHAGTTMAQRRSAGARKSLSHNRN